jgi:uncharacterized repeat protein (TIGR01451 family)
MRSMLAARLLALPLVLALAANASAAPDSLAAPERPADTTLLFVELESPPAAMVFAASRGDAPRAPEQIAAAEAAVAAVQLQIAAEQQIVAAALAAPEIGAKEIYRVRLALNGIAVQASPARLDAIRALPGVRAVRPLPLETPGNASSVPFVGAPQLWSGISAPSGLTGAGVRIGIIDTGVDYLHATFGGSGELADYQANNRTVAPDAFFPTAKVAGGYDFAGDAYTGANTPSPDPDPMDCFGHGTHVAGTAAGVGVRTDGTPFAGPFAADTPLDGLRIGPGVAPEAQIYALRVFGCGGGTALVPQAIDWALDPNGDGSLADRLDIINLSLGTSFGQAESVTALAAENAARTGMLVVAASGNSGDTFFLTSEPGSSGRSISVAGSVDSGWPGAAVRIDSPPALAGFIPAGVPLFGPAAPATGVSAEVVLAEDAADADGPTTTDGCSALTNAAAVAGKIALVDRGGSCGFVGKVRNAQSAGAIGVLIANTFGTALSMMSGTDPLITIPSALISFEDGAALRATPGARTTLLSGADTVFVNSSRGPRGGAPVALKPDIAAPGVGIVSAQSGTTCTGAAGSSGCFRADASGFLPGSLSLRTQGTSMAAPHVAGALALLRQGHPDRTAEELKALIMNTALHDITTLPTGAGTRFGAGRIGAGRLDISAAGRVAAVAFNADEPGLVSVSFDVEAVVSSSFTKHVRVVNFGTSALTFDLGFDTVVDAPGVAFALPDGNRLTLPPGGAAIVPVRLDATPAAMDHTRDATVAATQTAPSSPGSVAALGALSRHWLAEESAFLTLARAGQTELRVPLYAIARPASTLAAPDALATGGAATGSGALPLSGADVCTGVRSGLSCAVVPPTDVVSLVTPLELQAISPIRPDAPPAADLQYVGVGYDPVEDQLLFGVVNHGAWFTPSEVAFNIYVDCGVYALGASFDADTCSGAPDGVWDLVLFNTNVGGLAALFGSGASPQDVFVTAVYVIRRGSVVFAPLRYVNHLSASALDSGVFGRRALVLATDRARLKVSNELRYRVLTCPGTRPLCLVLGTPATDEIAGPLVWRRDRQGFNFGGARLAHALNGTSVPVSWDQAALAANGSRGGLLIHHHNTVATQAEPFALGDDPAADLSVSITAAPERLISGQEVTLTVRLKNRGPATADASVAAVRLPDGLTYLSHEAGAYDAAGGVWTAGALPADHAAELVVQARARTSGLLRVEAWASGATLDPSPANDRAVVTIEALARVDLGLAMDVSAASVIVGEPVDLTLTVTNRGEDVAYGLIVRPAWPAERVALTDAQTSAGTYNSAGAAWSLGRLASGQSATLMLRLVPLSAGALSVGGLATSETTDMAPADNSAQASIEVVDVGAVPTERQLSIPLVLR